MDDNEDDAGQHDPIECHSGTDVEDEDSTLSYSVTSQPKNGDDINEH